MSKPFPELSRPTWKTTRDALHAYSQIVGAVRAKLTPSQKHWWHLGLLPTLRGVSTGTIWQNSIAFNIELDMRQSVVTLSFQNGGESILPLTGQSNTDLWCNLHEELSKKDIEVTIDKAVLKETEYPQYSALDAQDLAEVFDRVAMTLEAFKAEQREETGPITLWPHHFDIAMLWFSGNRVDGIDPDDEENADEQMNFGFITEGAGISGPYFYATAYPLPKELPAMKQPKGAHWHSKEWEGAVMPYSTLHDASDPDNHLLTFFRIVSQAFKATQKEG